jgi:hypothetical protein
LGRGTFAVLTAIFMLLTFEQQAPAYQPGEKIVMTGGGAKLSPLPPLQ